MDEQPLHPGVPCAARQPLRLSLLPRAVRLKRSVAAGRWERSRSMLTLLEGGRRVLLRVCHRRSSAVLTQGFEDAEAD
jgi:hypothetical protein